MLNLQEKHSLEIKILIEVRNWVNQYLLIMY